MSILIIGAQGRLGSSLVPYFISQGYEVIPWGRHEIALEDEEACLAALQLIPDSVDVLINCAAIGSIEACTADPLLAHQVNARAPELMAQYARSRGIRFIQISTDYVLEGARSGLKNEQTKCAPINIYGESKLESEGRVMDAYPQAIIARVSWVFGNKDKPSFPDMIFGKIKNKEPLQAINDKWSLPTSMTAIAYAFHTFIKNPSIQGIIHVCNTGEPMTWYDYAHEILQFCKESGLAGQELRIEPTSIKQSMVQTVDRPIHSAMDNSLLQSLTGNAIRSWQDDLRVYLRTLL